MEYTWNNTILDSNMSNVDIIYYNNVTQNVTLAPIVSDGNDSNDFVQTIWNYFFGVLLMCCIYFTCNSSSTQYRDDDARRIILSRLAHRYRRGEEVPTAKIQTDLTYRNQVITESLIKQEVICSNDEHGNVLLGCITTNDDTAVVEGTNNNNNNEDDEDSNNNDVEDRNNNHDDNGALDVAMFSTIDHDKQSTINNTKEMSQESDESCCCAICLEPYQVGDIVAWSRHSDTCFHAFHQDCIIPWLQDIRHDDCPSCRAVLLKESTEKETEAEEDTKNKSKKNMVKEKKPSPDDLTVLLSGNNGSFDTDDGSIGQENTQMKITTSSAMFMIVHGLITEGIMKHYHDKLTFTSRVQHDQDGVTDEDGLTDEEYCLMEQGSSIQHDVDKKMDNGSDSNSIAEMMSDYPFRRSFSFGSYYSKLVSTYLNVPQKTIPHSVSSTSLNDHHQMNKQSGFPFFKKLSFNTSREHQICHPKKTAYPNHRKASTTSRHLYDKIPFRRIASAGPGTTITSLKDTDDHVTSRELHSEIIAKSVKETETRPPVIDASWSHNETMDDCSFVDDEEDDILHHVG
jgi:Zinc finger, C3HC4 type (RING finger)